MTPEERLDVYQTILLGRRIVDIQLSRDMNHHLTNWIIITLEDGGQFRFEDSDNWGLDPPIDPKKIGQPWDVAMPQLSHDLLKQARDAQ